MQGECDMQASICEQHTPLTAHTRPAVHNVTYLTQPPNAPQTPPDLKRRIFLLGLLAPRICSS